MPYCLSDRAISRRTNPYVLHGAALLTLLACTGLFNACGHSANANNSSSSGSTSGLNISASLPQASVGTGYNGAVTATGGTEPYRFSVISGQLPSGVLLDNTTGKLSGTPSAAGTFSFSVSVSDYKGASQQKLLQIAVSDSSNSGTGGSGTSGSGGSSGGSSGSSNEGKSFSNIQSASGWGQFGQGPPNFIDCSPSPCDGISFSMTQQVNSPSLSGSATIFNVGGSTPYSDALWNNHIIGPLSSQGTFDSDGTLVPSIYNFTYDVYFYGDNFGASQALEFDINQFFGDMGFIYGHECRIAAGNQWDVWDNANAKWVPTGVPCYPNQNQWNHLTLQVQRTSDNHLTYQSITLNGNTAMLNWSFEHGSASGWYGVTLNYQMDGNDRQDSYNVYLDNLTLTYQ